MKTPTFSIITPSKNMLEYLVCCVASVKDQQVSMEHLIIDGDSTDGTEEWLHQQDDLKFIHEEDQGMYDAINKGLSMSSGQILAYLNCDEQYLPGTLQYIDTFFDHHPDVDILFGNFLFVDQDGNLLSYRKNFPPRALYIQMGYLYLMTCSMFFRRRIIEDGFKFDPHWKVAGDADFVLRVLQHGFKAKYVKQFLSAFTFTGRNMGSVNETRKEQMILQSKAPYWAKLLKPMIPFCIRFERLLHGGYLEKMPLQYQIFTRSSKELRKSFCTAHASAIYPDSH